MSSSDLSKSDLRSVDDSFASPSKVEFVHPADQLEPGALSDTNLFFPIENSKVDAYRAQLSIAISLKRIADALHGDSQNTGMKHALAEMANRAYQGWGPSS